MSRNWTCRRSISASRSSSERRGKAAARAVIASQAKPSLRAPAKQSRYEQGLDRVVARLPCANALRLLQAITDNRFHRTLIDIYRQKAPDNAGALSCRTLDARSVLGDDRAAKQVI